MNYIKRSFASLFRNPIRSLVIFSIVFTMGSIVSASIATEVNADMMVSNVESSLVYSAKVNVNQDLKQLDPQRFDRVFLDQKTIDHYGKFKGVVSYDYPKVALWRTPLMDNGKPLLIDMSKPEFAYRLEKLRIVGTENGKISSFQNDTLVLVSGEMFTQKQLETGELVALIPENIATNNSLSVGDSINFENYFYARDKVFDDGQLKVDPESKTSIDLKVRIVGVYALSSGNAGRGETLIDEYQQLYMPNSSIKSIENSSIEFLSMIMDDIGKDNLKINENANGSHSLEISTNYSHNRPTTHFVNSFSKEEWFGYDFFDVNIGYDEGEVTYLFDQVEHIKPFIDYVIENSHDLLKVTSDSETFQAILSPIRLVKMIATFTKYLALAGLVFVLTLVVQLFINQRRYEIGVYLSIGEKRWKIMVQMLLETVFVSFFALLLTTQVGVWLANKTSQNLVASQLSEYRVFQWVDSSGSAPDAVITKISDDFTIRLTSSIFVEYILVGTLVVSLSASIPVLVVMRLNPKEIML